MVYTDKDNPRGPPAHSARLSFEHSNRQNQQKGQNPGQEESAPDDKSLERHAKALLRMLEGTGRIKLNGEVVFELVPTKQAGAYQLLSAETAFSLHDMVQYEKQFSVPSNQEKGLSAYQPQQEEKALNDDAYEKYMPTIF